MRASGIINNHAQLCARAGGRAAVSWAKDRTICVGEIDHELPFEVEPITARPVVGHVAQARVVSSILPAGAPPVSEGLPVAPVVEVSADGAGDARVTVQRPA